MGSSVESRQGVGTNSRSATVTLSCSRSRTSLMRGLPITPVKTDSTEALSALGTHRPWVIDPSRAATSNTSSLVYNTEFLVSYISRHFPLEPGDLIFTGTPPGVGMGAHPPRFLKAGDEMRLGIDGLGEQRQLVVAPR